MAVRPTADGRLAQEGAADPQGGMLVLRVAKDRLGEFFLLLQQGVTIPVRVGCSLMSLLCDQFGLDREYVTDRITTVFLNGRAIDDLESAVVGDGATVALSAAMPGLVGATMRRGGYYAAMRGAMTYHAEERGTEAGMGTVRLKLFNLLLTELGPAFLSRGIGTTPASLNAFFAERGDEFWEGCREILLNGTLLSSTELLDGGRLPEMNPVTLFVHFEG